jgi:8-oxo-dGTP pyrophosphatase MutT (NUDIX family)
VPPPETTAGVPTGQAPPWMEEVRRRLGSAEREAPEPLASQRRAGVLAPLFVRDGNLWVLLTKRTESVEKHRGQIAFPGGGQEEDDESLYRTALRETEEEIGVKPEDVRYLGDLTPIVTITDYYVEPYVGAIPYPYPFQLQETEIAGLIEVPIPALLDPKALEIRPFPGRPEPVLYYHYGETVIWGATARILKELLDALGDRS